jgi:hypothetical protein
MEPASSKSTCSVMRANVSLVGICRKQMRIFVTAIPVTYASHAPLLVLCLLRTPCTTSCYLRKPCITSCFVFVTYVRRAPLLVTYVSHASLLVLCLLLTQAMHHFLFCVCYLRKPCTTSCFVFVTYASHAPLLILCLLLT